MSCMRAPLLSVGHALLHRAVHAAQHIAAARFMHVQLEHAHLEVPAAAAAGSTDITLTLWRTAVSFDS